MYRSALALYTKSLFFRKKARTVSWDGKNLYDFAESVRPGTIAQSFNGTDEELAKYFDIEEIARNMLVSEFLKCHEAYSASTFFYRKPGGKIKVVQWDFDLGTGNISSVLYQEPSREDFWVLSHWPMPQAFLKHKNFQQIMIQQWEILRRNELSEENIIKMLDELEILLADAGKRNDMIFPDAFYAPQFAIWENNLESSQEERRFVKEFLIERGRWLDEHIYDLKK